MDPSPTFCKPSSRYGIKHLLLHVNILITKSGLTKKEFFERYPDFNHHDDYFPRKLLDEIRERKRVKKETKTGTQRP